MSALLEVRQLERTFGHGDLAVHAVDDASFEIQAGQIVSVVGESGSGKTTLARLLLGLLEPTGGQILLNGDDVTHLDGARRKAYWRRVQGVFQDPFASFNQFFTIRRVLDNALHVLEPAPGGSDRESRMRAALHSVGLDANEVLRKWPHQLSGGQRQRVMTARALLVQPELLIADEPTSMLDASLRATILNLLLELRDQHGLTILFITHDIGQAAYVSDRILVMDHGQIVEQGPAAQVLWSPTHPYTEGLMADVPKLHKALA